MLIERASWHHYQSGEVKGYPTAIPTERLRGSSVKSALITDDAAVKVDKAVAKLCRRSPEQCELRVVNAFISELMPIPASTNPNDRVAYQGNADNARLGQMKFFRVLKVDMWPTLPTRTGYYKETLIADAPILSDGSVRVAVPCKTPLRMQGLDAARTVIADDQMLHSVDGTRTCIGCHGRHSEEMLAKMPGDAEVLFQGTKAAQP